MQIYPYNSMMAKINKHRQNDMAEELIKIIENIV